MIHRSMMLQLSISSFFGIIGVYLVLYCEQYKVVAIDTHELKGMRERCNHGKAKDLLGK